MWDYEQGSIFDPYLYQPKPKKPFNLTQKYKPSAYKKPVGPKRVGLLQEFMQSTSHETQLKKVRVELKRIETEKKLMQARSELDAIKRQKRDAFISDVKQKIGFNKMNLPKAQPPTEDRVDEVKDRYTGKNRLTYRSDKERYEHQY